MLQKIKQGLIFLLAALILFAGEANAQTRDEHQVTIVVPSVMEMEFTSPPSFDEQLEEIARKKEKLSSKSKFSLHHNNKPLKMVVEGRGRKPGNGINVKASTDEPEGSSAISNGALMILDSVKGFFPAQDALTNITRGIYESGLVNWEMWTDKIPENPSQTITVTFTIVNN